MADASPCIQGVSCPNWWPNEADFERFFERKRAHGRSAARFQTPLLVTLLRVTPLRVTPLLVTLLRVTLIGPLTGRDPAAHRRAQARSTSPKAATVSQSR